MIERTGIVFSCEEECEKVTPQWRDPSVPMREYLHLERGYCFGRIAGFRAEGLGWPKLIYSAIASLDGYVADANGSFGWAMPDEEVHAFVNDLERPIGTYLYGRRMYEAMVSGRPRDVADEPPVMRTTPRSGGRRRRSCTRTRSRTCRAPERALRGSSMSMACGG